jgi:hypothetical protein
MLSGNHFYYRTIRRNVVAFGTIFKDIQMITYKKDTYDEIQRINVPLSYAGKENFLTRLLGNPDLHKPTQIVLPRMSFEMTGLEYDSTRKLSSYLNSYSRIPGNNNEANQQYSGVPYNITFELNIYIRNVEDGTQIVEQILPYFNPDYTLSMSFVDQMNATRDVPIILDEVKYDPEYQGTEPTTRILTWTLTFKMKTWFFGPINTSKIIKQATANTFIYSGELNSIKTLYMDNGFGNYKLGETLYQGSSLIDANTTATVLGWNTNSGTLTINNVQGNFFNTTANVVGIQSGASHQILKIVPDDGLKATVTVGVVPPTANIGDDFGFTETITEYD